MNKVTITHVNAADNREAWLALRRQHLTATDWPKITGTSRWGTAEEVTWDKLGSAPTGTFKSSLPMQVGTDLEPLIIKQAKNVLGRGEYLSQAFLARRHMGFTPDLIRLHKTTDWVLAEIKVSVAEWGGAVPPDYLDQVRFQATVLGLDRVQVFHMQLASWGEGLRLIKLGKVPPESLTVYQVEVGTAERKRIERQSLRWWKENILLG